MAQPKPIEFNKHLPVVYEVDGMPVKLTFATVKDLICRGQRHKPSDEEVMAFIEFCKYMKANPFIGDAHLIKYSERDPASFVVGVGYHRKKAEQNPHYRGFQSGIIVRSGDKIERREGGFLLEDEELLGGWCRVYRDDRDFPVVVEVNLSRYRKMRKTENGWEPQASWKTNAADMIIKVAESQAHRKAFSELRAAYTAEEIQEAPQAVDVEAMTVEEAQRTTAEMERQFFSFLQGKGLEFEEEAMRSYMSHLADALQLDLSSTYQRALDNMTTDEAVEKFKAKYEKWLKQNAQADETKDTEPAPKPRKGRGRRKKEEEVPPKPVEEKRNGGQADLFHEDLWNVWLNIPAEFREAAQRSLDIARPMTREALERLIEEANRIADQSA